MPAEAVRNVSRNLAEAAEFQRPRKATQRPRKATQRPFSRLEPYSLRFKKLLNSDQMPTVLEKEVLSGVGSILLRFYQGY